MNKFVRKAGVALVAVAASLPALAVDTTVIATETAAAKSDINLIGALIIGVVVAIAAIGWIRRVIR